MWQRNLGVIVALDNQEWKVYLKNLLNDPPHIFRLGWGADYPDPDNFMKLFTGNSGNNNTRWKNSHYDQLLELAARELDSKKRAQLYDEAQKILVETCATCGRRRPRVSSYGECFEVARAIRFHSCSCSDGVLDHILHGHDHENL
jgi:hypothetical protein